MHYPVLATVITQSQIHVQIKHSLANLQDIITTYFDWCKIYMQNIPAKVGIKSSRCAKEFFICDWI